MKKTHKSTYIIGTYFAIHGIFYLLSSFIATRYFIWESQWNFILGNPTLYNIHFVVPFILGFAYIVVAYGLVRNETYSRIGLLLLCTQAVFFEFPIGSILGIGILIYSFTPSFSKQFVSKVKPKIYRVSGVIIILLSVIGVVMATGFGSNLISFTSHEIQGYELAVADVTPESKIEGITQTIGIIDVMIELTETDVDYALEQQEILITDIAQYINRISYRFTVINAISVNMEASNLLSIAENENVKHISPVTPSALLFPYIITDIDVETASTITSQLNVDALLEKGRTGKGVVVAVMDTGIKKSLFQRNGLNIVIGSFSVSGHEYIASHGTMVTSCILDVAPGVDILDVNVFTIGDFGLPSATTNDILRGFEYVKEYKQQTNKQIILSCSWGISPLAWADASAVSIAASTLASKFDIPVICSAGNSGSIDEIPYQVMSPSGAVSALSVGAVDENNNIASFSSRGPYYNGLQKPDVVANGVNVWVTDTDGKNVTVSGTSFSCPSVSGIAALLLQDNVLSPEQVNSIIKQGASDLGVTGYDTVYGYGLVNAERSYYASESAPSIFDTTLMLIVFAVVGVIVILYPYINKKLR